MCLDTAMYRAVLKIVEISQGFAGLPLSAAGV